MMEFALVMFLGITAAMAGGSMPGSDVFEHEVNVFNKKINFTWLPELVLAVYIGDALQTGIAPDVGFWWSHLAGAIATVWSYMWIQSGHGIVLPWGRKNHNVNNGSRKQTLKPFVNWLAARLRIEIYQEDGYSHTIAYCRLYMAVKGFLIGLPVGGVPLAILWPLSYEIGNRYDNHFITEFLSGSLGIALSILIFTGVVA